MKRMLSFASVVAPILAFLAVAPMDLVFAQEPSSITVTVDEAAVDFPESITFRLEAAADDIIEQIELEYGVDRQVCGLATSRVPAEFEPGNAVAASWEMRMRTVGTLPPGSRIWWRWRIRLADGQEHRTDQQDVTFEDASHSWKTVEGEGLTIFWYRGEDAFGEGLLEAGLEGLERLGVDPSQVLDRPVQVFVYADRRDLRDAVIFSPNWIGGQAYTQQSIILMATAPQFATEAARTLRHELCHLVTHHLAFNCWGSDVPPWFDEGLSTYAEGDQRLYDELVRDAVSSDEILTLDILSGSFSAHGDRATLSYAQSFHVVRYLIETYGSDNVYAVLAEVGEGVPFEAAMQTVYGFGPDELESEWRESVGAPSLSSSDGESLGAGAVPTATAQLAPTATVAAPFSSTTEPITADLPLSIEVLLAAQPPPAPLPVGRATPAGPLTWLLAAGIVLLAVSTGLLVACLLIRRARSKRGDSPSSPLTWAALTLAVLGLTVGSFALVAYEVSRQSALARELAAIAFAAGEWEEALQSYDTSLETEPSLLQTGGPLALANRGVAALNAGNLGAAQEDLEAAIAAAPSDPSMALARTYLARTQLGQGDTEGAFSSLNLAVAADSKSASALALRALALQRQGSHVAAGVDAEQALALALAQESGSGAFVSDQDPAICHAILAENALHAGNLDDALAHADEALALDPAQDLAYSARGAARAARMAGRDAYVDAETALGLAGESAMALAARAGARLLQSDVAGALADADRAISLDEGLALAHLWRGASNLALGRVKTAEEDLDRASDLAPGLATALAYRARLALHSENLAGSLELSEQALALDPSLATARGWRAQALGQMGQGEEAQEEIERALQLNGRLASLYTVRAALASQRGDLEAALLDLDHSLTIDPSYAPAYQARTSLRLQRGDYDGAQSDADVAVRSLPSVDTHNNRARVHWYHGYLAEALAEVAHGEGLAPESGSPVRLRALILVDMHDVGRALAAADEAVNRDPDHPDAYLTRAYVREAALDYEGALADCERALELNPWSTWAYELRASLRVHEGDLGGALADADQAVTLAPGDPRAHAARAMISGRLGEREQAFAASQRAVALGAGDPAALLARAEAAVGVQQLDLTRADLEQVAESMPENSGVHVQAALMWLAIEEVDEAVAASNRALEVDSGNPEAYLARGQARLMEDDASAAIQDLTRAIRLNDLSAGAYAARSQAYLQQGKTEKALEDAMKAISIDQRSSYAYVALCLQQLEQAAYQSAFSACDRAVELSPYDSVLRLSRGAVHLALGRHDEALADYTAAIDLAPGNIRAYILRGALYSSKGMTDLAAADLEHAVSLADDLAVKDMLLAELDRLGGVEFASGEGATYTSEAHGFSLSYPEGWRREPVDSDMIAALFIGPSAGANSAPSLIVMVHAPSYYLTAKDLADDMGDTIKMMVDGYYETGRIESTLGGEPALIITGIAQVPGSPAAKVWLVFAVRGRQSFFVMVMGPSERFAALEPEFQSMLDSFTFVE